MPLTMLSPTLTYNGDAAQAIALYEKTLGAKVERKMGYGDLPPGVPVPPSAGDRIIYAMLRTAGGAFAVMDAPPDRPVPSDTNVMVSIVFDSVEELARAFETLGEGGTVTMPLHDAFWGDRFGMLTDRFGIRWMMGSPLKR